MVGEHRKQFAAVGKLDLMSGVGAKVDEYYQNISALEEPSTPEVLARRAAALEVLAGVDSDKDDHRASRQRLAAAGDSAAELQARCAERDVLVRLLAVEPENQEVQKLLGSAYVFLGQVENILGRFEDALASERLALPLVERIAARQPD